MKTEIKRLPFADIQRLLVLHPNTDEYAGMNPRDYLAARVKLLESAPHVFFPTPNRRANASVNQRLSTLCGWHSSQLYALFSEKAKRSPNGRLPVPHWRHAATLDYVTWGFIHPRYLCPDYWIAVQQSASVHAPEIEKAA